MLYILAVMANDPSRIIRRHVARSTCQSLALLVQMGEMKSNIKETESLLIEEDGSTLEKAKEPKKSELDTMIKVLRKDREVGKNEVLREYLMPIALYISPCCLTLTVCVDTLFRAPDVDHEVRWCILKLADILIRAVDETPPTVKIHIPSTPVTEAPPSARPTVKAIRTVKSGGPPPKSPLVPSTVTTKLKLPGSPVPDLTPRTPTIRAPAAVESSKKGVAFVQPALPPKGKSKGKPLKVASNTKPVHVPKAQSGGMSLNDLRASRNALKKLKSHKHAGVFLQPVDPIRDHAPKYVLSTFHQVHHL
jgi:transcription initiation factor TFIID subunit 2